MPGVEPEVIHAGSQAPFHPLQLTQVVSQTPFPLLPYTILLLEDHKIKKALTFSIAK